MATSDRDHAARMVARIKGLAPLVPEESKPSRTPVVQEGFKARPLMFPPTTKRPPVIRASGGGGSGGQDGGSGGGGSGGGGSGGESTESHSTNTDNGGGGMTTKVGAPSTGEQSSGFPWIPIILLTGLIVSLILGRTDVPKEKSQEHQLALINEGKRIESYNQQEQTKQIKLQTEQLRIQQKAVSVPPFVVAPANNVSEQKEGFNIVLRNGEQHILPPKSTVTLVSPDGSAMTAKIILPHRIGTYSGEFLARRLDSEGGESWTSGYQQGDPLQTMREILEGSYIASTTSVNNGFGGQFLQIFVPLGGKVVFYTKE